MKDQTTISRRSVVKGAAWSAPAIAIAAAAPAAATSPNSCIEVHTAHLCISTHGPLNLAVHVEHSCTKVTIHIGSLTVNGETRTPSSGTILSFSAGKSIQTVNLLSDGNSLNPDDEVAVQYTVTIDSGTPEVFTLGPTTRQDIPSC